MGGNFFTRQTDNYLSATTFDSWCVYLTRPQVNRYPPVDKGYFSDLKQFSSKYGSKKIYDDFTQIYDITANQIENSVLNDIEKISQNYGSDSTEFEILFTVLYAAMVAEQNKAYTKLGKRVKRLGMHQVLLENVLPSIAANYSKGKKWRDLDSEMKLRGF